MHQAQRQRAFSRPEHAFHHLAPHVLFRHHPIGVASRRRLGLPEAVPGHDQPHPPIPARIRSGGLHLPAMGLPEPHVAQPPLHRRRELPQHEFEVLRLPDRSELAQQRLVHPVLIARARVPGRVHRFRLAIVSPSFSKQRKAGASPHRLVEY
jgi:predicted DNA-binding protein (UPF0251 family)